jgi:hypothetical protein
MPYFYTWQGLHSFPKQHDQRDWDTHGLVRYMILSRSSRNILITSEPKLLDTAVVCIRGSSNIIGGQASSYFFLAQQTSNSPYSSYAVDPLVSSAPDRHLPFTEVALSSMVQLFIS